MDKSPLLIFLCTIALVKGASWNQLSSSDLTGDTSLNRLKPPPTRNAAVFYHDDYVYVYGGKHSEGRSADLWAFGVYTKKWQWLEREAPPGRLSGMISWSTPTHLWISGGRFDGPNGGSQSTWNYELMSREWNLVSNSTNIGPRYGSIQWRAQDTIYVLGGRSSSNVVHQDLWKVDASTGAWSIVSAVNGPGIVDDGDAVYDPSTNTAYIVGGEDDTDTEKDGVLWSYLHTSETWNSTPMPATYSKREDLIAFLLQGMLHILLGKGQGEVVGDSWTYSVADGVFERDYESSPTLRWGSSSIYSAPDDAVFLFGGSGQSGLLNDVWAYNYEEKDSSFFTESTTTVLQTTANVLVVILFVGMIFVLLIVIFKRRTRPMGDMQGHPSMVSL